MERLLEADQLRREMGAGRAFQVSLCVSDCMVLVGEGPQRRRERLLEAKQLRREMGAGRAFQVSELARLMLEVWYVLGLLRFL